MAMSEIARYRFIVSEGSDGTPYLSCQEMEGGLKILADGWLNFLLKPGITYERAQEIAKFLDANISYIQYNPAPFEHIPSDKDRMGPVH
jgi:hypothetical protein